MATRAMSLTRDITMERKNQGFNVAIGVSRFIMRTHGIWPESNMSKIGISHFIFLPIVLSIFYFINLPQTIQVCTVSKNLNEILNVLTLGNIPIGIAFVKLLSVTYKQNVLHELIVTLSKDWENGTEEAEINVMWTKAKISRKMSIICGLLCEGTVFAYTMRMIVLLLINTEDNTTKPMYFLGKFPYDTQSSPSFEITWIIQMIATFLSAGTFAGIDSLFITLVLHLCGQLMNLQSGFREINNYTDIKGSEFNSRLTTLIKKHHQINKFADTIENSFNIMFLFQVLFSIILLCLQGYLFVIVISGDGILVEMIFLLFFTICFTFSIFLYCYLAELLREESLQLGNAIFYSQWYNLSPKQARLLIIPFLRVKQPLEITVGKFCTFSLNLFCNIIRTATGYMSVLIAMREKLM